MGQRRMTAGTGEIDAALLDPQEKPASTTGGLGLAPPP